MIRTLSRRKSFIVHRSIIFFDRSIISSRCLPYAFFPPMPKRAAIHPLTGLRRCKRLKQCPRLCRWSNNTAGASDVMETLHTIMWKLTIFIVTSFHLLSLTISVEFIAEEDPGADMAAIAMIVELHHFNLLSSLELMVRLRTIDSMLFDIPAAENAQPLNRILVGSIEIVLARIKWREREQWRDATINHHK